MRGVPPGAAAVSLKNSAPLFSAPHKITGEPPDLRRRAAGGFPRRARYKIRRPVGESLVPRLHRTWARTAHYLPAECECHVDNSVKRGDIFYADLSPVVGSEQGGVRPVLIVQNDTGQPAQPDGDRRRRSRPRRERPACPPTSPLAAHELWPAQGLRCLVWSRSGRWTRSRLREHMGRLDDQSHAAGGYRHRGELRAAPGAAGMNEGRVRGL